MRQIPSDAPPVLPLMRVPVPWVFVMAYLAGAGLQILLPVRAASPLVTLVPMIGYLHWVVIPYEESRLLEAFGTPYGEYRARVGRWIGPW